MGSIAVLLLALLLSMASVCCFTVLQTRLALASNSFSSLTTSSSRSRPVAHSNRKLSSTERKLNMVHKEVGRWPPHVAHPTIWSKYKRKIEELSRSLANAGQAGLLAYGLLNFVYYNSVTVIAWIASGSGGGLSALAEMTVKQRVASSAVKMAKVAVIVWTSRQVGFLDPTPSSSICSSPYDLFYPFSTFSFPLSVPSTLRNTLHSALHITLFSTLHTLHFSALHNSHSTLHTSHSTLHTALFFTLYGYKVTKFFRIAGAVFFAPVADRLMDDLQKRFRLKSKNVAFWCVVAAILSSTALVYSTLIFWAVFEDLLRNSWALFF